MESFNITHRVGNNSKKGERFYVILDGLTKQRAETLIALILAMQEHGGQTADKGIQEKTWKEVMRSMEEFDGVPALRLPSGATKEAAEDVLRNVRGTFQFLMEKSPNVLDNMGQRHEMN